MSSLLATVTFPKQVIAFINGPTCSLFGSASTGFVLASQMSEHSQQSEVEDARMPVVAAVARPNAQAEYLDQLGITKRKSHVVGGIIAELKGEVDQVQDDEKIAEKGKLMFLTGQAAAYQYLVELLVTRHYTFAMEDITSQLTDEQHNEQDKFYNDALPLLRELRSSFDEAMNTPAEVFTDMYQELKTILHEYPGTCTAAVLGLANSSALYGSGIFGLHEHPSALVSLILWKLIFFSQSSISLCTYRHLA